MSIVFYWVRCSFIAMKTLKNACSIHWVTTIPPSATRERKLKFLLQSINIPWARDRKKPVSKQETSGTLRLNVCSWYDCFAKRTLPAGQAVHPNCDLVGSHLSHSDLSR